MVLFWSRGKLRAWEKHHRTGEQELFDALAALKGGDPKRIVFMGIGGSTICSGLYGYVDAPATLLKVITDLFGAEGRGVWWDLCSGQPMENGLEAAFAIIEQACDEFVPIE